MEHKQVRLLQTLELLAGNSVSGVWCPRGLMPLISKYLDMVWKEDGQTTDERQKAAGGWGGGDCLSELLLIWEKELYMGEFWVV